MPAPRAHVLHEASLPQVRSLNPNLAVLPWGATEAHGTHLPHGTDVIEASALGEAAVARANSRGARALLLPTVPFGINHSQLTQAATITLRASTQLAMLRDIAQSLLVQGIERLVILNFHGGNEFKPLIRDVMLDLPIFIAQAHGYQLAPEARGLLEHPRGDHADEFETSLLMHLTPQWVAPLESAADGAVTPTQLLRFSSTPGVWAPRDWAATTASTGVGDPRLATAEKGRRIFELLTEALTAVLVELSLARMGDYPLVIDARPR
jgi:creatinine amidohydrolase